MGSHENEIFERLARESPDVTACEFGPQLPFFPEQKPSAHDIPVFDARRDTMFVIRPHFGQTRPPPFEEVARPPR